MKQVIINEKVGITYPQKSVFRPALKYPEYIFDDLSEKNDVYDSIRECFKLAGYDLENYGKQSWNPLGKYINPGETVVLKPNLVMHKNLSGDSIECMYTQPSVVATVIDYVVIALKGRGKIVVGDAPMQDCDFEELVKSSSYDELIEYYRNKDIDISLVDFRELKSYVEQGIRHTVINEKATGKVIDLGVNSEFEECSKKYIENLRITNYDPRVLNSHHSLGKHEYYISDYILNADVIINMPKPKTHRKAGVTLSLKNMVGVNVRKEFLPHHSIGAVGEGGDEYRDCNYLKSIEAKLLDLININTAANKKIMVYLLLFAKKINRLFMRFFNGKDDSYSEGSWYGNHTISKTISDINKIVAYADKNGIMRPKIQRRQLIVADMIVSGEKEGPVLPTSKPVGAIVVSDDLVAFDKVVATMMGMDIKKIPTLNQIAEVNEYSICSDNDCIIVSNRDDINGKTIDCIKYEDTWKFTASSGWVGHIELDK